MSRPVPEAAPVIGIVLAVPFALYGVLFGSNHLSTVVVSVALLYGFTAFGIARSPDPTTVFRPDSVLAVGVVSGGIVGLYGVASGEPLFGALVAVVVAAPPALYHARFGESINPLSPTATLGVGLVAAGALLAFGSLSRPIVGGLTGLFVGFAAVDYHRQRGRQLTAGYRTVAVVACLGSGLVAFGLLVVVGRPTAGLVVGVVAVAIGTAFAAEAQGETRWVQ